MTEFLYQLQHALGTWLYSPIGSPFVLVIIRTTVGFLSLVACRIAFTGKKHLMGFFLMVLGVFQLMGAFTTDAHNAPALSIFTLISNLALAGVLYLISKHEVRLPDE